MHGVVGAAGDGGERAGVPRQLGGRVDLADLEQDLGRREQRVGATVLIAVALVRLARAPRYERARG